MPAFDSYDQVLDPGRAQVNKAAMDPSDYRAYRTIKHLKEQLISVLHPLVTKQMSSLLSSGEEEQLHKLQDQMVCAEKRMTALLDKSRQRYEQQRQVAQSSKAEMEMANVSTILKKLRDMKNASPDTIVRDIKANSTLYGQVIKVKAVLDKHNLHVDMDDVFKSLVPKPLYRSKSMTK
jgi:hypothetical protein